MATQVGSPQFVRDAVDTGFIWKEMGSGGSRLFDVDWFMIATKIGRSKKRVGDLKTVEENWTTWVFVCFDVFCFEAKP